MKRLISFTVLLLLLGGCAAPRYCHRDNIDCYYQDKRINRDFRGKVVDKEYINSLKGKIEGYLLGHLEINEESKSALKNFKVVKGLTKEQVELLLGVPEKTQVLNPKNKLRADERWVYTREDLKCIYFFALPLLFTHDAYHLYFRGNILLAIEDATVREQFR